VEAYLEPLHHENATLREEREEWTQFVTQLQQDHDALVAEV
jgi:cell division protein FtsB